MPEELKPEAFSIGLTAGGSCKELRRPWLSGCRRRDVIELQHCLLGAPA